MTPPTTTPHTDADAALIARLEAAMKATHDASPTWHRWTDTAAVALQVIADWQAEQRQEQS